MRSTILMVASLTSAAVLYIRKCSQLPSVRRLCAHYLEKSKLQHDYSSHTNSVSNMYHCV